MTFQDAHTNTYVVKNPASTLERLTLNKRRGRKHSPVLTAYKISTSIIESVLLIPVRARCKVTMSTLVSKVSAVIAWAEPTDMSH